MELGASVKVGYWVVPKGDEDSYDLDGIEDFRQALAENYISVVQSRRGDCGGGIYELAVEFVSNVSLSDALRFLLEGMAYDLIKSGTKSFVLRPFLSAYEKLKGRNNQHQIDIEELRITFQDSTLVIRKITKDSIFPYLGEVLRTLAIEHQYLVLASGKMPLEIHIPVFEDPAEDRLCRYRVLLDVDETIEKVTASDYFKFWGLVYDHSNAFRVYDVERRLLLDTNFYTLDQYWSEWDKRFWSEWGSKQSK